MKTCLLVLGAAALAASASLSAVAADGASVNEKRFANLKALTGDWTMAGGDGLTMVSYRVVGAGSAVVETIMPGMDHEMVTVYTLDKGELVLTHYCSAGNQPHMKADKGGDAASIAFKFDGGGNMADDKVGHMHNLDMAFVDADHVKASWHFRDGGKETEVKVFDLVRKKA